VPSLSCYRNKPGASPICRIASEWHPALL
jgi:hypothetical protein